MAPLEAQLDRRPKVGVASVVVQEGQVLLGKRKGSIGASMWATPGGHLEYGETVEACAVRELFEETGLVAKSLQYGPYTNGFIDHHQYVTLYVFILQFEGYLSCLEPHKCEGWEWFDWDALPEPLIPPLNTLILEYGKGYLRAFS